MGERLREEGRLLSTCQRHYKYRGGDSNLHRRSRLSSGEQSRDVANPIIRNYYQKILIITSNKAPGLEGELFIGTMGAQPWICS